MGLIADLEFPHVVVPVRRQALKASSQSHSMATRPRPRSPHLGALQTTPIMRDTPLVPRAAAEQVLEEACRLVDANLPAEWTDRLVKRAETTYENAQRFRRRLQSAGDEGREWLWAFMRHWLAALIQQERPELFNKLPSRYAAG